MTENGHIICRGVEANENGERRGRAKPTKTFSVEKMWNCLTEESCSMSFKTVQVNASVFNFVHFHVLYGHFLRTIELFTK